MSVTRYRRIAQTILVIALISIAGCSGGGSGGSDGGASGNSDWCGSNVAATMQNPQAGQEVTWTVDGVVSHGGREVCKATAQVSSSGPYTELVMYFTEDRSYLKYEYYDADGTLVNEMEVRDGEGGAAGGGQTGQSNPMGG